MSLQIRRIERAKDFVSLAPLWCKLASESGQTSPFLSYDWFWCCWHAVWPHRRPEILLIEEAGSPIAIVPMMAWRERLHGLSVRCLGLLECPITPMVDILMPGEHGHVRVLDTLLGYLVSRSDWDMIWLQKLPATSLTVQILQGLLPGRLPWRRVATLLSPSLAITMEWATFHSAKSQNFKKLCQQMQGQLEGSSYLRVEEHRAVPHGSPLLSEMIDITRRGWQARSAPFSPMPRLAEFLTELTGRATKNGWLSLWLLRLDGRAIALEYQLRHTGTAYTLHAEEDPAHQELSPGSVLKFAIVRSLFQHGGIREYDMGPGLSDDKLRWANGYRESLQLKIYRPGIYSRLLYGLETVAAPAAWK
jgi:hypothetical protein